MRGRFGLTDFPQSRFLFRSGRKRHCLLAFILREGAQPFAKGPVLIAHVSLHRRSHMPLDDRENLATKGNIGQRFISFLARNFSGKTQSPQKGPVAKMQTGPPAGSPNGTVPARLPSLLIKTPVISEQDRGYLRRC